MQAADFDFDLPESSIAQAPLAERAASRLLCVERKSGRYVERVFGDLTGLLRAGDCLVLNDTRVVKARLFALKSTGGRVEILVERAAPGTTADAWLRFEQAGQSRWSTSGRRRRYRGHRCGVG